MTCEKTAWSVLPRRDKDLYQMVQKLLGVFFTHNRPDNLSLIEGDLLIFGPCYLGIFGLGKTKNGGTEITKRTVILPEIDQEKPAGEWVSDGLKYRCHEGKNKRMIESFIGENMYSQEIQLARIFQTLPKLLTWLQKEKILATQPIYTMVINGVSRFGPIEGTMVKKAIRENEILNLRLVDVGERTQRVGEPPDW